MPDKKSVVDLNSAVEMWATTLLLTTGHMVDTSKLIFEIDFKDLKCKHSEAKFDDKTVPAKTDRQSVDEQKFFNTSEKKQEWLPSVKTKYIATSKIEVRQGFVKDALPDVQISNSQIPGTFSKCLNFTSTETLEKEQEFTDSKRIIVPPNSEAEMSVVLQEKEHSKDFTITSTMRGKVRVTIKNENNDFIQSQTGRIERILDYHQNGLPAWARIQGKAVIFETKGSCSFRYATDTRTILRIHKINYIQSESCVIL